MRAINMAHQHRIQDFSQFLNPPHKVSPAAAGQPADLMPQIMAHNYKKMMRYNKQVNGASMHGGHNSISGGEQSL